MSRTPDIGVVGVKYWSYMAEVMAGCLDQIIKGQKTEIPINVFRDALLFFRITLEQKTGTFFDNPVAQINAYVIAQEILRDCPLLSPHTLEEAKNHLRRFAEFLKSLEGQPTIPVGEGFAKQPLVPLGVEDRKTANDLRDFFAALVRKSDRDFDYGESRD